FDSNERAMESRAKSVANRTAPGRTKARVHEKDCTDILAAYSTRPPLPGAKHSVAAIPCTTSAGEQRRLFAESACRGARSPYHSGGSCPADLTGWGCHRLVVNDTDVSDSHRRKPARQGRSDCRARRGRDPGPLSQRPADAHEGGCVAGDRS